MACESRNVGSSLSSPKVSIPSYKDTLRARGRYEKMVSIAPTTLRPLLGLLPGVRDGHVSCGHGLELAQQLHPLRLADRVQSNPGRRPALQSPRVR